MFQPQTPELTPKWNSGCAPAESKHRMKNEI